MSTTGEITFALRRFTGRPGSLEVSGDWDGARVRRARLVITAYGRRHRLTAHTVSEDPWTAHYAFAGDPADVTAAELQAGRVVIDLPLPEGSAGDPPPPATAAGADVIDLRAAVEAAAAAEQSLRAAVTSAAGELRPATEEAERIATDLPLVTEEATRAAADLRSAIAEAERAAAELRAATQEAGRTRAELPATEPPAPAARRAPLPARAGWRAAAPRPPQRERTWLDRVAELGVVAALAVPVLTVLAVLLS